MKTDGSSNWTAFSQFGDEFLLSTPVLDINGVNIINTATTQTLASVPTGVKVIALLGITINNSIGGNVSYLLSSLDTADVATSPTGIANGGNGNNGFNGNQHIIRTNTSAQIRMRASTGSTALSLNGTTQGWIDRRGRDN